MKILLSATIGDNAPGFRRNAWWLWGSCFALILAVGLVSDLATDAPRTTLLGPLPTFALLTLFLAVALAYFLLLAVIYSSHRWRREAAIDRQSGAEDSLLVSIYLRRDVRYFLESGHGFIPFGGLEESVTLEFTQIDISVWRGGSKPRLIRKILWKDLEPLHIEEMGRGAKAIFLQRIASPPVTAFAFVAIGIIGFRRKGLDETIAMIEGLRPAR